MSVPTHLPRLLFLQHGSLYDGFGGVEYYLDDLETLCAEIYGTQNSWAIIPQRKALLSPPTTPYHATFVPRGTHRGWAKWSGKLENRFSPRYFKAAQSAIARQNPTLLISGHVALGPLTYALSCWSGIPYQTIVYGIECWGKMWPQDEFCLRRGKGIVSISDWTKSILKERGYSDENIRVVNPRLPTDFEAVPPPAPRDARRGLRLITVSRLDAEEQYKGHDHVLKALHELKREKPSLQIEYVIQGEGTDRHRLEMLTEALGLRSVVKFSPAVRHREDLLELYRSSDVFIMPSRYGLWEGRWRGEGFGIVYLEAAAFGLPSIAYRCGGVTDIVRDGYNGLLVEPDDISALASAIDRLASDTPLRARLSKNAYDHVMARFTRASIRQQVMLAFGACGSSFSREDSAQSF